MSFPIAFLDLCDDMRSERAAELRVNTCTAHPHPYPRPCLTHGEETNVAKVQVLKLKLHNINIFSFFLATSPYAILTLYPSFFAAKAIFNLCEIKKLRSLTTKSILFFIN